MRIKLYRSVILQETCLKSYPAIDISLDENTSEGKKGNWSFKWVKTYRPLHKHSQRISS